MTPLKEPGTKTWGASSSQSQGFQKRLEALRGCSEAERRDFQGSF